MGVACRVLGLFVVCVLALGASVVALAQTPPDASPVRMPGPPLIEPDAPEPGFTPGKRADPASISRAFEEGRGDIPVQTEWVLTAAGGALMLLALVSWLRWWKSEARRSEVGRIAWRAARAAGLSRGDGVLLWRVASARKLPSIATLLVSPMTLRKHGLAYADGLPMWAAAPIAERVHAIARHLERPWRGPNSPESYRPA